MVARYELGGQGLHVQNTPIRSSVSPLDLYSGCGCIGMVDKWEGVPLIEHYLNCFIMFGRPESDERTNNFQLMLKTCGDTGMPVEPEKSEAPRRN